MKVLLLLPIFLSLSWTHPSHELRKKWNYFKNVHGKSYDSTEELKKRFKIFEENLKRIEEHNILYMKNQTTYRMAINQFADLSQEEFSLFLNSEGQASIKHTKSLNNNLQNVPEEIDWRQKGADTDVKNQGQCGSSWIFALTGCLEGQNFVTNGILIPLSDQELIKCVSDGCNGNYIEKGFEYVIENGLSAAADYPSGNGTCQRDDIPSAVTVSRFITIDSGNEDELKEAVGITGPVAASIDATDALQFYGGGYFYDYTCNARDLNHGVLIVGYGSSEQGDYWIVKNSWGAGWGEAGYFNLARNAGNNCGIASQASYPVLSHLHQKTFEE